MFDRFNAIGNTGDFYYNMRIERGKFFTFTNHSFIIGCYHFGTDISVDNLTYLDIMFTLILRSFDTFFRHQRRLKARAFLMREAVRNGDYAFRLPTSGLLPGERALQQALNDMQGDIARLVARHEVESWQKLTRVLTHEIMNATAPISSICQAYLSNPQIKGSEYEEGIQAIHDTSKSLTNFVDSYRKLTQLQAPVVEPLPLVSFLESIKALYPDLSWHLSLPQNATLEADRNMLRQVFINLTKNAIEAHATDIDVRMSRNDHPILLFSNNGEPIPADVAREIFIPFFTTKSSGTGIGLSLSRQMLMMQNIELGLSDNSLSGYHVTFYLEKQDNS